jgi:hypothetical protein
MNLRKRNVDLRVAAPFNAWVCGFSLSGLAGLIPVRVMDVSL